MVEIIVPVHQVKYGAVTLLVPDEEANKLFGEDVPLQTAKRRIKKLAEDKIAAEKDCIHWYEPEECNEFTTANVTVSSGYIVKENPT